MVNLAKQQGCSQLAGWTFVPRMYCSVCQRRKAVADPNHVIPHRVRRRKALASPRKAMSDRSWRRHPIFISSDRCLGDETLPFLVLTARGKEFAKAKTNGIPWPANP